MSFQKPGETKLVVTKNCRSLLHFFELRCCNRGAMGDSRIGECDAEYLQRQAPRRV